MILGENTRARKSPYQSTRRPAAKHPPGYLSFGAMFRELRKRLKAMSGLSKMERTDTLDIFEEDALDIETYQATGVLLITETSRAGMGVTIGRHQRTAERLIAIWKREGLAVELLPGHRKKRLSILQIVIPGLTAPACSVPTFWSPLDPTEKGSVPTPAMSAKKDGKEGRKNETSSTTEPFIATSSLAERARASKKVDAPLCREGDCKISGKGKKATTLPEGFSVPADWLEAADRARSAEGKIEVDLGKVAARFVEWMIDGRITARDWQSAWMAWASRQNPTAEERRAAAQKKALAELAADQAERDRLDDVRIAAGTAKAAAAAEWAASPEGIERAEAEAENDRRDRDADALRAEADAENRLWNERKHAADAPARALAEAEAERKRQAAKADAERQAEIEAERKRAKARETARNIALGSRIAHASIHAPAYFAERFLSDGIEQAEAERKAQEKWADLIERVNAGDGAVLEIVERIENDRGDKLPPSILQARELMAEARP